jgi:hypothetical protein
MPPILLLFPGFPEGYDATVDETYGPGEPYTVTFTGGVETLPGKTESSRDAVLWFSGHLPSMWISGDKRLDEVEHSPGAGLVQNDALVAEQADELDGLRAELGRVRQRFQAVCRALAACRIFSCYATNAVCRIPPLTCGPRCRFRP